MITLQHSLVSSSSSSIISRCGLWDAAISQFMLARSWRLAPGYSCSLSMFWYPEVLNAWAYILRLGLSHTQKDAVLGPKYLPHGTQIPDVLFTTAMSVNVKTVEIFILITKRSLHFRTEWYGFCATGSTRVYEYSYSCSYTTYLHACWTALRVLL